MSEKSLQTEIMLAGSTPTARLWRNVVGSFPTESGGRVRTGLAIGSSDLIGLTAIEITPAFVGRKVAVFTAIEVKAGARVTDAQLAYISMVRGLGGIAGIAESVKDYQTLIDHYNNN